MAKFGSFKNKNDKVLRYKVLRYKVPRYKVPRYKVPRHKVFKVITMTTKNLFYLLLISIVTMLVSGCKYFYDSKKLDFNTVYAGFNGPDIGRGSYYNMQKFYAYSDATSVEHSWLKTALPANALKKIIDATNFKQQFILIYMSESIAVFNSLEIASIRYTNPEGRVGLDVFAYRNISETKISSINAMTYPFTIAVVEKPKEPYIDFYPGGSYFEQNRAGKPEKPQTGTARTFEEVKNDGAKLTTIELLYLGLDQCLTLRKQAPKFCSKLDIERMRKHIDLAIAHYAESTPTLESILKANSKDQQVMAKENPQIFDEKSQKDHLLKMEQAIKQAVNLRAEILKKVAANKKLTAHENP